VSSGLLCSVRNKAKEKRGKRRSTCSGNQIKTVNEETEEIKKTKESKYRRVDRNRRRMEERKMNEMIERRSRKVTRKK
jgi:hypothetical protein